MEMGAIFSMVRYFSMPGQLGEQEAQQEEAQEAEEAQEGKTTRRRRGAEAQSQGGREPPTTNLWKKKGRMTKEGRGPPNPKEDQE